MKKVILTATFTGADGSCGYKNGEQYKLTVTMFKGNIKIAPAEPNGLLQNAEYGSIFAFLTNWNNVQVLEHGKEDERSLTFGEEAAGIDFNPGGMEEVNIINRRSADLIDFFNDERSKVQGGKARYYSKAISNLEDGQMNGVKAATWRYK